MEPSVEVRLFRTVGEKQKKQKRSPGSVSGKMNIKSHFRRCGGKEKAEQAFYDLIEKGDKTDAHSVECIISYASKG